MGLRPLCSGIARAHVFVVVLIGGVSPGWGQNPAEIQKPQAGIHGLLVSKHEHRILGHVSRLTVTATKKATPGVEEIAVNQNAGPALKESLMAVRQYITATRGGLPEDYRFELAFSKAGRAQDGASTSLAVALLFDSLLTKREIDSDVCVTGEINAEGNVQRVRHVIAKIRAARAAGKRVVIIPGLNEQAITDLVLLEGPEALYGIQVIGVDNVDAATNIIYRDRAEKLTDALQAFDYVAKYLQLRDKKPDSFRKALANRDLEQNVKKVLKRVPGHLSAKYLLKLVRAKGKCGFKLSLKASIEQVNRAFDAIIAAERKKDPRSLSMIIARLDGKRNILNEEAHNFANEVLVFGRLWEDLKSAPSETSQKEILEKIDRTGRQIRREYESLVPKVP